MGNRLNYFLLKKDVASVYTKMGRGRNLPEHQSQNKPKICNDNESGENIISGSVLISRKRIKIEIQYSYQTMMLLTT